MCTCEGHCDGKGGLHYRFGEFSIAERCCRCRHVAPADPQPAPTPEPMATQGESERKTAYTLGLESVKHYEKRIAELEQRIAALTDPHTVHVNILRGTLPLTREQALHIAGANDYDDLKARIAAREELAEELEREMGVCNCSQPCVFQRAIQALWGEA